MPTTHTHTHTPNPKNRPERETTKASAAKHAYLAMGAERTLRKLAEQMADDRSAAPPRASRATPPRPGLSQDDARERQVSSILHLLKTWSATFGWQEAAKVWDAERARERAARKLAELDRMNDTQAEVARGAWLKTIRRLNEMLDDDLAARAEATKAGRRPEKPSVSAHALVQLMAEASDVWRLALGAATEIAQQQHEGAVTVNFRLNGQGDDVFGIDPVDDTTAPASPPAASTDGLDLMDELALGDEASGDGGEDQGDGDDAADTGADAPEDGSVL